MRYGAVLDPKADKQLPPNGCVASVENGLFPSHTTGNEIVGSYEKKLFKIGGSQFVVELSFEKATRPAQLEADSRYRLTDLPW